MGDLGHIFYSDYYVLRIITYYYEKLRLLTLCFMSGLQTVGCRHQLSLSCLQQITVLNQFRQTLFLNLSGWGYKGLYENTKCYQNCPLKGDVHFSLCQSSASPISGHIFPSLLCLSCQYCKQEVSSLSMSLETLPSPPPEMSNMLYQYTPTKLNYMTCQIIWCI